MMIEKPKARPGMVCWSARWDRDGKLREALYRPVEKPLPPAADPVTTRPARGAMATERQGSLL